MRLRDYFAERGLDPDALLDYDWPMSPRGHLGHRHPQRVNVTAQELGPVLENEALEVTIYVPLFDGKAPEPEGGWPTSLAPPQFTDMGEVFPVPFQGGVIGLQGNGCPGCGNGFWTESDAKRRLPTGSVHHCPHCGEEREVTS